MDYSQVERDLAQRNIDCLARYKFAPGVGGQRLLKGPGTPFWPSTRMSAGAARTKAVPAGEVRSAVTNTSIRLCAIFLGGAWGAACAILSAEFFDTTATQLGYIAACAIFGGISSAVISAGVPKGATRKFRSRSRLKNLRSARLAGKVRPIAEKDHASGHPSNSRASQNSCNSTSLPLLRVFSRQYRARSRQCHECRW